MGNGSSTGEGSTSSKSTSNLSRMVLSPATAKNTNVRMGKWHKPGDDVAAHTTWMRKHRGEIAVWKNQRSMLSHASLGFGWEVADGKARYLMADLVITEFQGKLVTMLRFSGPEDDFNPKAAGGDALDPSQFTRQQIGTIRCTLLDVQNMIEQEYGLFGDYHQVTNNCQHFANIVRERLKANAGGQFNITVGEIRDELHTMPAEQDPNKPTV